MGLSIEPLHACIGAAVTGIDLREMPDEALAKALVEAFEQHHVLVFPDQVLTDEQHIRFSRLFGDLEVYPVKDNRGDTDGHIFLISNVGEDDKIMPPQLDKAKFINLTQMWHTDSSYRPIPSKGAVLRALELPPEGGDTLWVNMFAVYASLNEETQAKLSTLSARHDYAYPRSIADLPEMSPEEKASVPPVVHPLIRTHPDGRKSLYISPVYAPTCEGMGEEESQRLLQELLDWATRDEFTYHHKWRVNDVVMWDNRCTIHRVMPFDWVKERRVMRRTALAGVDPVR